MAFKLPKLFQRQAAVPDNIPSVVYVDPLRNLLSGEHEYSTELPAMLGRGGASIEAVIEDLLYGYYSDYNFIRLFYSIPEIYAPINEIATRVSDAMWQMRKIRKTGALHDDEVIYTDPTFNRLFAQPNPLMTFKDFVWQAVCYELLTGKCYQHVKKSKLLPDEFSSVISWWNFPVPEVQIETYKNVDTYSTTSISDFIYRYIVNDNGIKRVYSPDEVLPFLRFDLKHGNNPRYAKSPLCGASVAIRNLIAVYMARGKIYIKQGPLGMFVSNKGDATGKIALTTSERQQFYRDMQNEGGLMNGTQTYTVTNLPMEYIQTGSSINELMPFDETLQDAVSIYATLRVPRHLVPSKDTSTFSNASADLKSLYSDTVIPFANKLAEAWTNFFKLRDQRKYIYPDFSHVDVLQENKKEKADVDKINAATNIQQFLYGHKTLNDCLTATGADENSNPLYDMYLPDMTQEQLEVLRNAGILKAINTGNEEKSDQTIDNSK